MNSAYEDVVDNKSADEMFKEFGYRKVDDFQFTDDIRAIYINKFDYSYKVEFLYDDIVPWVVAKLDKAIHKKIEELKNVTKMQ